jgi:hypothetical protein
MKTAYPNLQKKMDEQGISPADLARHCNIAVIPCVFKLLGILPWKFTEVVRICRFFGDAEAELLFVRLDIIS